MRAVLDTNIIVSALLWGGPAGEVFQAARNERFVAVLTDELLAETRRVLSRTKFAERIAARGLEIEWICEQYRLASDVVVAVVISPGAIRDPKDIMILGCALGGKADYIVSGDKDLLTLSAYERVPIVSGDIFLKRLSAT